MLTDEQKQKIHGRLEPLVPGDMVRFLMACVELAGRVERVQAPTVTIEYPFHQTTLQCWDCLTISPAGDYGDTVERHHNSLCCVVRYREMLKILAQEL